MSGRSSSETSFDVYIYQIAGSGGRPSARKPASAGRRGHASRRQTEKQRDRAATRLKRKAAEFLAQAGELRKLVARLSTPENLTSPTVFAYFECLIPRLNSIFQITEHIREGVRNRRFPSGVAGLDFLLRVVKNLTRQIEAALAVADLETGRCRRRPAYFDVHRLLEQACRSSQSHYLAGEVGLTVNPRDAALQVRAKRHLWHLVLVDLICRAEELSPRKGIAARLQRLDEPCTRLTLLPRGALLSADETRQRAQRQKFLGRTSPDQDPSFGLTRSMIEHLGGSLTTRPPCRAYVTPLFTVEIPIAPEPGDA